MWMIVGLGNPGSTYKDTPHNLGFEVVSLLAERHKLAWKASRHGRAEVAEGTIGNEPVMLAMPTTFMNLSGEAIGPISRYYKINPAHILVVCDDVAIPWGKIRIRDGGSHGGHNGLRNLIDLLSTDRYPRIRVGCAPEGWPGTLRDYVLCKMRGEMLELAKHMAQISADAAEEIIAHGVQKGQNRYNSYNGNGK